MFDNIPTYKWSDLVGKELKIYGSSSEGVVTIIGVDKSSGISYLLFSGKGDL